MVLSTNQQLFFPNQIQVISDAHLVVKQKNAAPEKSSKCTCDPLAFNRRFVHYLIGLFSNVIYVVVIHNTSYLRYMT